MARRYIGNALITIEYDDSGDYSGTVQANGHTWWFDDLRAPAVGFGHGIAYDSAEAYDKMAASAVSFGSYYTTHNRGDDVPEWAPSPEVADAIDEATSWAQDDRGRYEVRRSVGGRPHMAGENRTSKRRNPMARRRRHHRHYRPNPTKSSGVSTETIAVAAVGVAVIGVVGYLIYQNSQAQAQLAQTNSQLAQTNASTQQIAQQTTLAAQGVQAAQTAGQQVQNAIQSAGNAAAQAMTQGVPSSTGG